MRKKRISGIVEVSQKSYLLQTPCCVYFQVKELRQLEQVSHFF